MKVLIIIISILIVSALMLYAAMVVGSRSEKESNKIKAEMGQNQTISNTDKCLHLKENNGENSCEYCVVCGAIIPEGRQVCPNCERGVKNE